MTPVEAAAGLDYTHLDQHSLSVIVAKASVFQALGTTVEELSPVARPRTTNQQVVGVIRDSVVMAGGFLPERVPTREAGIEWLTSQWEAGLWATQHLARNRVSDSVAQLIVKIQAQLHNGCSPSPFEQWHERINALCQQTYGDYWRRPSLILTVLGAPPGGESDPFAMSAATFRYELKSGEVNAEVTLGIAADIFDPTTWAAVPRLLAHEYISHVVGGHPADEASTTGVFAEGVMDWAAEYYFETWIRQVDRAFADVAIEHGLQLREALERRDERLGAARRTGRSCARRLVSFLSQHTGRADSECRERVARLAVEVNLAQDSLAHKDEFAAALDHFLDDDGSLAVPRPRSPCQHAAADSAGASLRTAIVNWSSGGITAAELLTIVVGT